MAKRAALPKASDPVICVGATWGWKVPKGLGFKGLGVFRV